MKIWFTLRLKSIYSQIDQFKFWFDIRLQPGQSFDLQSGLPLGYSHFKVSIRSDYSQITVRLKVRFTVRIQAGLYSGLEYVLNLVTVRLKSGFQSDKRQVESDYSQVKGWLLRHCSSCRQSTLLFVVSVFSAPLVYEDEYKTSPRRSINTRCG